MVPPCSPCQGNMESAVLANEILEAACDNANSNTLTSGQDAFFFTFHLSCQRRAATEGHQEFIFHHHETLLLTFFPFLRTYVRF